MFKKINKRWGDRDYGNNDNKEKGIDVGDMDGVRRMRIGRGKKPGWVSNQANG